MIIGHLPDNCHPNRPLRSVDGAVIHFISDRYRHPDDPFNIDHIYDLLASFGFSYHVIIPRTNDEDIIEMVAPELEAWHAGKSRMNGRDWCNRWTRGIALIGGEGWGYPDDQIIRLAQYTAQDMSRHGYTTDDIKGHEYVREEWNRAHPTKRDKPKPDPGELFPWEQYKDMLSGVDLMNRIKRDQEG